MSIAAARIATAVSTPAAARVTAIAAAAFRVQLGAAATAPGGPGPGAFRADVSGFALAALARTFDFDAGAIAVLDHAQGECCAVVVTPARDGLALLACADRSANDLLPARRPPAR